MTARRALIVVDVQNDFCEGGRVRPLRRTPGLRVHVARRDGLEVRVLTDLVAGVADSTTAAAIVEMAAAGVEVSSGADGAPR